MSGYSVAVSANDCIYLIVSNLNIDGSGRLTDNKTLSYKSPALKSGKSIENNGGKDYWQNQLSKSTNPNIGAFGK